MYAQHFGLRQDPFSIAPDPRFLFMSARHREALAHLMFGVAGAQGMPAGASGGFVLLTGDIGTGKTTVCRCFLAQIPSGCQVAYIFNPKLSVLELLQSICEEFHIALPRSEGAGAAAPTLKSHTDALNAHLLRCHAAGESCVLVIDEAQNLQADVLEQLRLLTNLETNERKLLQIVLIGQPELRTLLAQPHMEQLAQRVVARFHLDALTEAETAQYVAHRLAVAGHTVPPLFDRAALRRVHQLSQGVPRRINLLCGRALLGAWAQGLGQVTTPVVNKAAAEVWGAAPRAAVGLAVLVLAVAGAGVGGLWWVRGVGMARNPAVNTAAAPGTSAVLATVSAKNSSIEAMDALLPLLPTDQDTAWRGLAAHWGLKADNTAATPCEAAAQQGWPCYSTGQFNVALLKQLNRPGVLTLQPGNAPPVHATLVGLDGQNAVLHINGTPHTVRWVQLAALWRGEWATHWRPPPGYTQRLADGAQGPPIDWLVQQLSAIDGQPPPAPNTPPPRLDAALRERVRAFQRAHGLPADGRPGAMTFMQMDNATGTTGSPAPQLQTPAR